MNRSRIYFNFGNPFYGKKHSIQSKNKISKARIGKKYPKLSESLKGHVPWNKGLKHSKATIEKIKQARLKQILPNKNTSLEIKVHDFLNENNIQFETHYPILGQPDIFIKPNLLIFCDGCYWHKCSQCGYGNKREKDFRITKELKNKGYKVIRIWEHELKKKIWQKKIVKNVKELVNI